MDKQWYKEEKLVFEKFKNSLNKVKTFPEVKILCREIPPIDTPGRIYYTRLIFFLDGFEIPAGLTDEEKLLYKNLVERLDKTGQLKPEEGQKIVDKINNDI